MGKGGTKIMIEKMQKENREELKKALEAIERVGKEYPSIYKLKISCWSRWWRVDETLKSLQDVARGASMAYYMWWCNSCIEAINDEVEYQKMPKELMNTKKQAAASLKQRQKTVMLICTSL